MTASIDLTRRALLAAAFAVAGCGAAADPRPLVEVWKSPRCGCCKDWIAHLEANGFRVRWHNSGNTDVRARLGLPLELGACHTARVGGYAIEGHVPAREVHRLLKEKPRATGLAVPAMPVGSPGMDGPEYGSRRDPYDVLLVLGDKRAAIYQPYR